MASERKPFILGMRCRVCGAEFGIDYTKQVAIHGMDAVLTLHSGIHHGCPKAPIGRNALAEVVTIPLLAAFMHTHPQPEVAFPGDDPEYAEAVREANETLTEGGP